MTDGIPRPDEDAPSQQEQLAELAAAVFDLARAGDAKRLAAYLDAGAPLDLTDHKGDTLVMLAAYHGQDAVVAVLLEHGADPDLGTPTARETAHLFGRADLIG